MKLACEFARIHIHAQMCFVSDALLMYHVNFFNDPLHASSSNLADTSSCKTRIPSLLEITQIGHMWAGISCAKPSQSQWNNLSRQELPSPCQTTSSFPTPGWIHSGSRLSSKSLMTCSRFTIAQWHSWNVHWHDGCSSRTICWCKILNTPAMMSSHMSIRQISHHIEMPGSKSFLLARLLVSFLVFFVWYGMQVFNAFSQAYHNVPQGQQEQNDKCCQTPFHFMSISALPTWNIFILLSSFTTCSFSFADWIHLVHCCLKTLSPIITIFMPNNIFCSNSKMYPFRVKVVL